MSEPFIGEIRMFAGNFAPRGWALCDGQLMAISQNDALFSLFGTIYGGDGRTTFALPDLRGRAPMHLGSGPGLTPYTIGARGGAESVTLSSNQLPVHTHGVQASAFPATSRDGADQVLAQGDTNLYGPTADGDIAGPVAVGGSQSHTNLMPYQCLNFIVALVGIYPSRS